MSVEELKCFVTILLLSAYIDVPRWRLLSECNTVTYNPAVDNTMKRKIKKNSHCCDNNNHDRKDKAKLLPPFNMLNKRYMEHPSFQQQLSIDESIPP